jgi:hypothetical protein
MTKASSIKIDFAGKSLDRILSSIERRTPGKTITKSELIPQVSDKVQKVFEESGIDIDYVESVTAPDEKWIRGHWSAICKHLARRYGKYVIWIPCVGVRLGTLQEYQDNQNLLANITMGVRDCIEDRTRIIHKHGGQSFLISVEVKLLEAGELPEQPVDIGV